MDYFTKYVEATSLTLKQVVKLLIITITYKYKVVYEIISDHRSHLEDETTNF